MFYECLACHVSLPWCSKDEIPAPLRCRRSILRTERPLFTLYNDNISNSNTDDNYNNHKNKNKNEKILDIHIYTCQHMEIYMYTWRDIT